LTKRRTSKERGRAGKMEPRGDFHKKKQGKNGLQSKARQKRRKKRSGEKREDPGWGF